jgi:hypothetical protein
MSSVGGARICLLGSNASSNDSLSTLKQLGFCQFFYTTNQTLAQTSIISLELTRVINRTEPLSSNGLTICSGLWQPASTVENLSDQLLYEKTGDYLRYSTVQTKLIVQLTKASFYVRKTFKNQLLVQQKSYSIVFSSPCFLWNCSVSSFSFSSFCYYHYLVVFIVD